MLWARLKSAHYLKKALDEFYNEENSDAFLVAFCLSNPSKHVLVTQEVSQPERKSKIKIPDVLLLVYPTKILLKCSEI